MTDMSGKIIAFNEAILRPGGYTPEEMAATETVGELYLTPKNATGSSNSCRSRGRCVSWK